MTYTYVYQKCTDPDCGACNLIDAERCWYCNGEELDECQVEWQSPWKSPEGSTWEEHAPTWSDLL